MQIMARDLEFPEGPIAMADGSVVLVEIAGKRLTRVDPTGRVDKLADIPGGPNGAAIGPDGRVYVCNNGGGETWARVNGAIRPVSFSDSDYRGGSIDVVDIVNGAVETLYDRCGDFRLDAPNDIVFDTTGGFYFTDLGKHRPRTMDRGFVYWAKADGSEIREIAGPMITPNGIGLSPDQSTLYVAETDTGRVWAWEIVAPGELRKRPWPAQYGATLVTGFDHFIRLDSLAISRSGRICVAGVTDCSIIEIWPDGSHWRRIAVPDMTVTNICFGADDDDRTAYVTLSWAGTLAKLAWHEDGLAPNFRA